MNTTKEKLKNIEILRFIGANAIILHHFIWGKISLCHKYLADVPLYANIYPNFSKAMLWCDFFFIISGFFLFWKTDFSISFIDFFKKKLIRFYPLMIFLVFCFLTLDWLNLCTLKKYDNFFYLFLINNTGFFEPNYWGALRHTWFIAALFWTTMLFFYLRKTISEQWMNLIMGLGICFSYTFLLSTTINPPSLYYHFINIGILRAIGGLSIGYFIAKFYTNYKSTTCTKFSWETITFTLLELYCLYFIIKKTMLGVLHYTNWLIYIIIFTILFILFLLKKGYISQILNNQISVFLGRYTFAIYMIHMWIQEIFSQKVWIYKDFVISHPILNLIIPYILALFVAVLTYHFVEQPAAKLLNKLWFKNKSEPLLCPESIKS